MDRRRALLLTAAACVPLAALVYVAAVDVLAFRQLDIRVSAGFIALSGPHTRALTGDLAGLIDPGGLRGARGVCRRPAAGPWADGARREGFEPQPPDP
jgi:hypothetical protein